LDPRGAAWDSATPSHILKGTDADGAHQLFQTRKDPERGFDLREVSVLAAMLEHVVHRESSTLLEKLYGAEGHRLDAVLTEGQVGKAIEAHCIIAIFSTVVKRPSILTKSTLETLRSRIPNLYSNWPSMQQWLKRMRASAPNKPKSGRYTFDDVLKLIEYIADHQGSWQDLECKQLKTNLMNLTHAAEGRVPMAEFYRAGLRGSVHFLDSLQYLLMLGVVDETFRQDGQQMLVIPNYIGAPSNCVAGSDFYSVCCMDECNPLLERIESQVLAPNATAKRILEIVRNLDSATVPAPRNFSDTLIQRLESIAQHHGGVVPLHGRLFMQWMHNAYPFECRYPHLSGTVRHTSLSEWMQRDGNSVVQSHDEMKAYVDAADKTKHLKLFGNHSKEQRKSAPTTHTPWSAKEELWMAEHGAQSQDTFSSNMSFNIHRYIGTLMFLMAIVSTAITGVHMIGEGSKRYNGKLHAL